MMLRKSGFALAALLGTVLLGVSGCGGQLDSNVATFNANATKVAQGGRVIGTLVVTPLPGPTSTATPPPNNYDLSSDQTALLVHAWGQVYGLPSQSQFSIKATQQQVATFLVNNLQTVDGLGDTVKGGNATLGSGQFRVDLAIVDTTGKYGGVTVTFQPTLDQAQLKLNLLGSDFGSYNLPLTLRPALGDEVHTTLTGARDDNLSKVVLTSVSLDNGVMLIVGVVK